MPDVKAEDRYQYRSRKRRRKRYIKLSIGIFIGLLCLVLAGLSIRNILLDNTYRNEDAFNTYIEKCFDNIDQFRTYVPETEHKIIEYDKPLSIALKYPETGLAKLDKEIKEKTDSLKEDFYNEYVDLKKREKTLRISNYELFSTQREVTSVVLMWEDQQKLGFDMIATKKYFQVYNYSSETGEELNGLQIFNVGYKEYFSDYLREYLVKNHMSELTNDYESYLEVSDENLNDYILTDGGVRFYFQQGTVLRESSGIVTIEVDYAELDNIIRKKAVKRYVDPSKPMVALTYDDGPYPKVSNRILNCLSEHNAAATFFMLGEKVKRYPEVVKRKAQLGMEIGSHTWSHPNLYELKKKEIRKEISKTNDALVDACGQSATVFRPPYGNIDDEILETVDMPAILWSVDTLDWESRKSKSIVKIVKKIEKKDGLDGRVILMHSLYPSTAKATEILVPWLQEKGYQLVTVTELLQYRYHEEPENGKLYGYDYFYID